MSTAMPLSRYSEIHDLNDQEAQMLQLDYRPDLAHSNTFPIMLQPSYIPQKECDLASDILNNNNNRLTFTEFLTTDTSEQFLNEAYEFANHQQPHQNHHHHHHHHHQQPQPHAIAPQTTCSSPASDYSLFSSYDDTKIIKMEYPDIENACSSYYNIPRSLSVDSSCCPELAAVCNPSNISTSSLSPVQSPLGQSPIMSPCGLPPTPPQQHPQIHNPNIYHHCHEERDIPELMIQSQSSQSLLMQDQDFQSMVTSIPSPASSTKTAGKSRGRRMSAKPTKPGTKCFECTYSGCGRVFKRSEHLKRHVRSIHTLERPFHCPYPHCSKRFSRSDNLSQHLRVHRPNGKDKHPATRIISNFTPFLQTYHQNGSFQ